MLTSLFVLAGLFLTGCMVGPDYQEPEKPILEQWKIDDDSVMQQPCDNAAWWEVFHDNVLTQLIHEGYAGNLSLQSTGVKVLQARAQLAQSVGELYPQQQNMIGNLTRYKTGGSEFQGLLPNEFMTDMLGLTANWEIDFWGKYRRAIQSNNATFLASIAAYDNALVTLTSDIASVYIKIRTTEEQIKITQANIKVQLIGLDIAKARHDAGEVSLLDVEQAVTELSQTQAKLPQFNTELQKQKDALCLLLGTVPNQLDCLLDSQQGIPQAPFSVAVGIPVETIAKRPDVCQSRLVALAQSELIGATKANLFPVLSLSGTFAFASNNIHRSSLSDLFDWSKRTYTGGPGLNWPILNYGQITNSVRAQDAAFQEALLNYIDAVLKAQQEVQDYITAFINAKMAVEYLTEASRAATKTLQLALIRYKEGESDFTPVLNAEQQQLRVQSSLTTAQGDIPQALVSLYRSLGGGWQISEGDDVIPERIKEEMSKRTDWGSLLNRQNHEEPNSEWQSIKQLYLPNW
ncbi:MAG: efflux transporter outer membrane subunit [Parachlamydiaceae bacterium]